MANERWIAVDLDGTLAHYDHWRGVDHIGAPIQPMIERVKRWLREGRTIKIFTARVSDKQDPQKAREAIAAWLVKHGLGLLEITNIKDFGMDELWDDRAVGVQENTGKQLCRSRRGLDDEAPALMRPAFSK